MRCGAHCAKPSGKARAEGMQVDTIYKEVMQKLSQRRSITFCDVYTDERRFIFLMPDVMDVKDRTHSLRTRSECACPRLDVLPTL